MESSEAGCVICLYALACSGCTALRTPCSEQGGMLQQQRIRLMPATMPTPHVQLRGGFYIVLHYNRIRSALARANGLNVLTIRSARPPRTTPCGC